MVYTIVKSKKVPHGDRFLVDLVVNGVTQAGDYVSTSGIGLTEIEYAFATASGVPTPLGLNPNGRAATTHGYNGDLFMVALSGTSTTAFVQVVGR